MRLVVCFLSLLTVFGPAECGNVLVWFTEGSHWINLKIVLEALIDRGHDVTVLVPGTSLYMKAKDSDRFTYQPFNVSMDEQEMRDFIEEFLYFSVYEMDELNLLQIQKKVLEFTSKLQDMSIAYCDGVLKSPELMDKLRNGKFEVVLTDPIYQCSDIVAEELNVPLVYTFRLSIANVAERLCGQLPAPPSYVPGVMSKLTDKMSFTERIINMLFYLSQDFFATIAWRKFDTYYSEYLGRPTTYCEMMGKADIWLIRTYWDFEFPRPFLPNFKYVGGLHCRPAKPLPEDMEEFAQSSGDDGIVVFTLGSLVDKMPKEISNKIASALAQIPQKVLWRYGGEKPDTLGENTRIYKWIPQNDLLGHPKTKAFITHGGTNGIYEAIYHAVPMVGIPLFGDQPDNLVHMKARGAALVIDNIKTMEPQDLVDKLNTVINDPSYKENAMRLSRIHHDRPVKPLDESVFWIEFVMRNKGAKHLRVESHNLTWYQYHCLDVFAFLITILTVVLYDMEEFVQSSADDGIVIFTLGSLVDRMPKKISNKIASALAQIPQKTTLKQQSQDLVDGLNAVINDPSYKENAMRLSKIHHDRPIKPLDESVFWIEFVMRNKGAKHLRVEAHNLTWLPVPLSGCVRFFHHYPDCSPLRLL
ncbi:UDP-glucuronosyltransferase 2C1-like protein [Labeo rohita]|uniref:glucuronosyltransferase n=1 Tax=Labeo rohita TaxID=84645 RepID=A0A498NEK8_LABRO|nr:UDP-glucuronosyltransferase 2C1-like protein [Labeo rohita]